MEIFYSENVFDQQVLLEEEESRHLLKVLRHRIGDEVLVTDGKGKLFRTRLVREEKKKCVMEIVEIEKEEKYPDPLIHIAIAPTKNIERFEWFLEKSTEIGVSAITPIICQRSERDKIRLDRLEKVIISAMKQSLRLWCPALNEPIPVKQFISLEKLKAESQKPKAAIRNPQSAIRNATPNSQLPTPHFICHCQSQNLPSLKSLYKPNHEITIMIGPEGDFTRDEITLAEENGFVSVSLGESRLRTETAGILAIHTVQVLNSK